MNKLYLDSANIDEIKEFMKSDAISGVTTNPSLVAKEKKSNYNEFIKRVSTAISESTTENRHLSVEVTTLKPEEMFKQALALRKLIPEDSSSVDLYIKIPLMVQTLPIITRLKVEGIQVNATACMSALQAKIALDAGASVVSFFFNRMIDGCLPLTTSTHAFAISDFSFIRGDEPREVAKREITYFKKMDEYATVICGSIRKKDDVMDCWLAGADIVTASAKIIREIVEHPETTKAIYKFQADIDSWLA